MLKKSFWALVFIFVLVPCAYALEKHEMKPITLPKNMEKMMPLIGHWEGTHKTEKGEEKVPLVYELSSGKSIIVEKIFAGADHEMVSVYNGDGQDVVMTHYCGLGNQPRMRLTKTDGKVFEFNFVDATNMKPNDPHMHSLTITMLDHDHLTQEWTYFENGKAKNKEVFQYVRK